MGKRAVFALTVWLLLISVSRAEDDPQLLTTIPLGKGAASETGVPLDPEALVLVELRVAEGDTLWQFAKRYLARPEYYAQFLVYNHIKNPNRIYPGQALWVPLGRVKDHPEIFSGRAVPRWILLRPESFADPPSRPGLASPPGGETVRSAVEKSRPGRPAGSLPHQEMILSPQPTIPVRDTAQAEFEQNLDLFNRGDYSTAAGRFESFLAAYPDSSLRVTAEYYLAESYRLLDEEP